MFLSPCMKRHHDRERCLGQSRDVALSGQHIARQNLHQVKVHWKMPLTFQVNIPWENDNPFPYVLHFWRESEGPAVNAMPA